MVFFVWLNYNRTSLEFQWNSSQISVDFKWNSDEPDSTSVELFNRLKIKLNLDKLTLHLKIMEKRTVCDVYVIFMPFFKKFPRKENNNVNVYRLKIDIES